MAQDRVSRTDRRMVAILKAVFEERDAMKGRSSKPLKASRRTEPRQRAAKLTREMHESFRAYLRSGLCLCQCGEKAFFRGLAKKCYFRLKNKRDTIAKTESAEKALEFDRFCQKRGYWFPPNFIDEPFDNPRQAWDEKAKQLEKAS